MSQLVTERKKRDLFNRVAIESGISSIETVKRVYYGMVRVIGQELKDSGLVVLPGWGKFRVHNQKGKIIGALRTKERVTVPDCKILKYTPDAKLKEYVKNLE